MLLKHNFSKVLVVFLAFLLIFSGLVTPSSIKAEVLDKLNGVEVLANNEKEIRLKVEVDGLIGVLVQDQATRKLTMTTFETTKSSPNLFSANFLNNENVHQYSLRLNDVTDNGAHITIQDQKTREIATYNPDENLPSFIWVIPLIEVVGAKLIEALLLVTAVVAINGMDFAKTDSIAAELRNNQKYDHYYAKIMQKDVWIGSAISESVAVTRLGSFNGDSNVTGNDVWSRSMSKAALVAKKAGGGKEPIGPEIEKEGLGFGYYYHYHTWNRVGGHSFF